MLRVFGDRAVASPVVLPWSSLSQMWLLASQSADDTALIRVAGFGYMEHTTSRFINL